MDRIHDVTLWTRPVGQDGLGSLTFARSYP